MTTIQWISAVGGVVFLAYIVINLALKPIRERRRLEYLKFLEDQAATRRRLNTHIGDKTYRNNT